MTSSQELVYRATRRTNREQWTAQQNEPIPCLSKNSINAFIKSPELETHPSNAANPPPAPTGRHAATSLGNAALLRAPDRASLLPSPEYVPITSSAAIPSLKSPRCESPFNAATTTCFGNSPGRRPSVNAMSTSGTIVPRRLKTPIRNAGASGIRVTIGQSTTSSTSSTEKQNRSRPARKTQYCRSGSRSSENDSLSRNSPPPSSACGSAVFSCSLRHQANLFTALINSSGVNGLAT